jgi:PAS domain S-box-containing protein
MEQIERLEPSPMSEGRYRLLIEAITDYAIYMIDPTGRIASWNPGAERFKGYAAAEILGQSFSRFYTDEDRAAGRPQTALRIAEQEGRFEGEGWRVRKDGRRFWAHVVIDPIRDDTGALVGFAKITRDLTERREMQKALDEAREALFQSQKMEAIGQLTGGVAHDFNNLLMAVLGSLELVRKRLPPDPRITPLVDNAILGAERGAALTQRMLAFARKQELRLEAVDIPPLVRGMLAFLQRSIGPGVRIETWFPEDLPYASSDPNQLETAILNLAVNARDAMPDGGTITISAGCETVGGGDPTIPAGDYVRLHVTDTGVGMDEETRVRAMEPFFTTKGVGKGTGLGLSMVHGLAAQSGGRLGLRSAPGRGTSVELWLPVATEPPAEQRAERGPAAPAGEPLSILVVDDDRLVLVNTSALLEDLGHRVIQASSAREALKALDGAPDLDLVVSDQVMPEMSGIELRNAIERARPGLPVLIATGYAEIPPDTDPALPRLTKPFTQAELSRAVLDAVGGRRAEMACS